MDGFSSNYPKVSIITVCFNSEATIRDTLKSVAAQDYPNIEHIIIDGSSTDRTLEIIEQHSSRVALVVSESDDGLYDAMNKGIKLVTGDIIGILNSDDFYEDSKVIADVVNAFVQTPSVDIVYGDVTFVRPEDVDRVVRYYAAEHFRPWKLRFGWMPPHPATFVRRKVYQDAGLYRTDMKISADYEMFVRWLCLERFPHLWINRIIVRMRTGGISTSGLLSSIELNREIVQACRSHGIYTNFLMVLSKLPFKLIELLRRPSKRKSVNTYA